MNNRSKNKNDNEDAGKFDDEFLARVQCKNPRCDLKKGHIHQTVNCKDHHFCPVVGPISNNDTYGANP